MAPERLTTGEGSLYGPAMNDAGSSGSAARPGRADDLAALIGLLAVLEGEMMTGAVSTHLASRIRTRRVRQPGFVM